MRDFFCGMAIWFNVHYYYEFAIVVSLAQMIWNLWHWILTNMSSISVEIPLFRYMYIWSSRVYVEYISSMQFRIYPISQTYYYTRSNTFISNEQLM